MSLRNVMLSAAAALGLAIAGHAQGTQAVIGGGCPGRVPPTVAGPLTVGSTMWIESTGCVESPSTTRFMLFGVAIPRPNWVPVTLMTGFGRFESCDISVLPAIVVADFSRVSGPIAIQIPNDPIWSGFPLALESYCSECGFAGCFQTLTQGLLVTIE